MTIKTDTTTASTCAASEDAAASPAVLPPVAIEPLPSDSTIAAAAEEPLVKKRRTKNFQLREDLAKARGAMTVYVPAFEPLTFDTWDEFIQTWNGYMSRTKTMYRRRSSSTTTYWNSKHKFKKYPVPEDFKYATMAYWCTHGCIQPSRGHGVRTHLHNRYTGCSARITADVVFEMVAGDPSKVRWLVRVRNQIAQHNHRISDEIYNCYTNNSSVPDELLLGRDAEQHLKRRIKQGMDDAAVSALLLKEALANEHKMNMAVSEMQPLIDELKNTPSRVIHKRLQDVSEMVAHLQAKWHQDRVAEDAVQAHAIAPVSSLSAAEQIATAPSEVPGKSTVNSISSVASLPPGAAYYLTPRVEQIPTESNQVALASATTDSKSDDEAASVMSDRELSEKSEPVVENQRGLSEAV
uniref:Uncharacterized protein n=1 Tax=Hyaloperonospora arabidopsidis (strain Emoy2) TaxID=559515 RepID=M4BEC6_HYAAE